MDNWKKEISVKMEEGIPIFNENDINYIMERVKKQGQKHSKHKLQMSKLFVQFPKALQALMLASTYGHNKYKETDVDWKNYKNVEGGSENYWDANIRHQIDKELEGDIDTESNLPHVFHEAWNAMVKCEIWIEENGIDIKNFTKEYLNNLYSNNK